MSVKFGDFYKFMRTACFSACWIVVSCFSVFAINCSNNVLSDYTISGNSVQNGTPTPSSPVNVVSVGDKTANLIDTSRLSASYSNYFTKNSDGTINCFGTPTIYQGGQIQTIDMTDFPDVATLYNIGDSVNAQCYIQIVDSSNTLLATFSTVTRSYHVITKSDYPTATLARVYIARYQNNITMSGTLKPMLVSGNVSSSLLPYVPYGYKIPVTVMHNGTTITTNIYASAPLRKVGDYADTLNSNGMITRNVGIKVLDGTESWEYESNYSRFKTAITGALVGTTRTIQAYSTHYECLWHSEAISSVVNGQFYVGTSNYLFHDAHTSVSAWTTWLASQYSAGTPVTVYYPLATPTTESITLPSIAISNTSDTITIGTNVAPSSGAVLSCILESAGIKIATTKYVETKFAGAVSELNTTMGTIKNVVDNTIIQADRIGKLAMGKQTRPAENCPDGAECLLITEADGSLHWYPICNADGSVGTQSSN